MHGGQGSTATDCLARPGGEAVIWVGANFWSRVGGPRMWVRYDRDVVASELQVLAEHGCNVTRSFCYWPDFVPQPGVLDEGVVGRFVDFLDLHSAAGLTTIPTFIVGHMSGENWDPAWRQGRDLYRDVWMVGQQAWFVEALASRAASHPAVSGWLLTNEMPIYGGEAEEDVVTAWAGLLLQALRAAGAGQPASVGDGAWGVESTGHDNGFSLRRLAPLVDFVGPHVYPMGDDVVRQHLTAAFTCELAGGFGRPVVLEEFGVTSDFVSDENAAHYYRQVLYSTLLAGARGWIAWNNCDYDDLYDQDPYRHHPFEMHFGLTDRTGQPKAQLEELGAFSRFVHGLDLARYRRPAGAALVVPEHLEVRHPFSQEHDARTAREALFQAYVAAKEADLPIRLSRERDGLDDGVALYLAPSTKALTAPGWLRLAELAAGGATVYWSYFPGDTANQNGPWTANLGELFGVRHGLRYGLVDPIEDDTVTFRFVADFGGLVAGSTLRFRAAGTPHGRAWLPVEPQGAEVVAEDEWGRPALLRHRLGDGQSVLCTYPIEYMAARTAWVNPEDTWRLYDALATVAGLARPVVVEDPRVLVDRLVAADGHDLIFVTSQDAEALSCKPTLEHGVELFERGGSAVIDEVTLAPFAVVVLEARDHSAPGSV